MRREAWPVIEASAWWRKIALLALVPNALLVSACSERIVYDTPYLSARTIDAVTNRPVSGASVEVWSRREPEKRVNGSSDADGNVLVAPLLVAPLTRQSFVFGPWDPVPPSGRARIEAPGYVPVEIDVAGGIGDTSTVALRASR
jgi:hypothetical protein